MGWKYTVQVWGQHFLPHSSHHSMTVYHGGQHLLPALLAAWRAKRSRRYGYVTLELR